MMIKHGMILLVDDDPMILQMVGDRLRLEGYTVTSASRCEKALETLKDTIPDLIILDISMPGLGGLGFLRRLTDVMPPPTSPILVFTGRHELASFFKETTDTSFMPKTTNPEIFIQKVNELVARHKAARQSLTPLPGNTSARKLLLVEDDTQLRDHLRYYFTHGGMVVEPMKDGHNLLATTCRIQPDIILMKYLLPHHNGPDLAAQLGTHEPTQHIPVVLYDETGIHANDWRHPHVKCLVASAKGPALMKAIQSILGITSVFAN